MVRKLVGVLAAAVFATTAVAGPPASLILNEGDFNTAVNNAGSVFEGLEDFESGVGTQPPGAPGPIAGPLADPLQPGVANLDATGFGFANGLSIPGLQVSSNVFGADPFDAAPGQGLILLGPNFLPGQTSNIVGAVAFADSTDLIFTNGDNTAVSLDIFTNTTPTGNVQVTVFDVDGNQILQDVASGVSTTGSFAGVVSDVAIGRINIADPAAPPGGGELVDNVALYAVPEPATLCLLAMGGMVLVRRRR